MGDEDDQPIYERACIDGRIIVAQDADFGTLLWTDPQHRACVILFRLSDARVRVQAERLADVLARHAQELTPGTILVLTDGGTRIRRF